MTTTTEAKLEILKQDRMGRVRMPKEKREKILDEYEGSGMRGPEFAGYVGMKYQTLATWVQKRRREKKGGVLVAKEAGAMHWVEAELGEGEETGVRKSGLVVELPGGVRMEVGDERGAVLAAAVLRHLGAGRC